MALLFVLYFISSNALSRRRSIAILFSRSSLVLFSFFVLLIYCNMEWHFFEKSNSLYNSLLYFDFFNFVLILFIILLVVLLLCLTAYYPCIQVKTIDELPLFITSKTKLVSTSFKKLKKFFNAKVLQQALRDHYKFVEYPLIIQFILVGSITLSSCNDVITMFLCIELQSYGLYILSSIYRNSESSTGAGLTYFLLGGLSSCIILLGQSFIYINSGLTELDGLYVIQNVITSDTDYIYSSYLSFLAIKNNTRNDTVAANGISTTTGTDTARCIGTRAEAVPGSRGSSDNAAGIGGSTENPAAIGGSTENAAAIFTLNLYQDQILLSFVILSVGLLFKISAAPFHSWSPGVYDAIPTVTTAFVAIIPKVSILVLLFDLVYNTGYTKLDYSWTNILLYSSYLSLLVGSVSGLSQLKIKRLYAYSTISHLGFILLALCVQTVDSVQGFFFYIIQYSLSNVNAFFVLIVIGYSEIFYTEKDSSETSPENSYLNRYKEKLYNLSPIEFIKQLKGYMYLNPILVLSFSITLYSFIGVPPLLGFFAKQMVLFSALDHGNIFMCIIAILTSVISAVYYLYIIKHMFFEKNTNKKLANLACAISETASETISDDLSETVSDDLSEAVSDDLRETVSDDLRETVSDDLRETVSDDLRETVSDDLRETVSDDLRETVSDDLRQTNTATESNSRATLYALSKILLQDFSTPSGILLFIISTLTFISILFLFLYYEIYFLMNILSIVLIF